MILNAQKFSWKKTRGTAFASDLGMRVGETPATFTVRSPSGRSVRFQCSEIDAADGDIRSWLFESVCGAFQTLIFND